LEKAVQQQTLPTPAITPRDPAVQVVDSAYQIVTMIGANPRAIRPILSQRRLTKEQVLEAADSAVARANIFVAEMDEILAEFRADHDAAVADLTARLQAWGVDPAADTAGHGDEPPEVTALRGELAAATDGLNRLQAGQRPPRTFCERLQERAARVREVYAAL
jgi:hypothetical protein